MVANEQRKGKFLLYLFGGIVKNSHLDTPLKHARHYWTNELCNGI